MTETTLVERLPVKARRNPLRELARKMVHARLGNLSHGRLCIRERDAAFDFGHGSGAGVTLTVHDAAFYTELAFGGSVGAGESYMLGHWRADDLTAAMRLLLRNRDALDAMEGGLARLAAPLRVAAHLLERNTRAGSRRNIGAHYDLGNDFFALFLDRSMMYSCALFEQPDATLEEAQAAKLDRVCKRLDLQPGDHVLEIGSGWGGFALHAATRYGSRVTTTTISKAQAELARQRVRAAGLEGRVVVLQDDYRDLAGRYDKLVSIEMIEAIGHRQFGAFFARCAERLAPGGRMLLQSITIDDRHYARARDEVDFIKRYVFPGCCIPSLAALAEAMHRSSDLRIVRCDEIGPHYATTLAHWRRRFLAGLERVRALGTPESFIRMWEFYLCYCEAGFAERALGDVQLLLARAPRSAEVSNSHSSVSRFTASQQ